MRAGYLRIVFSAVCGIICMLLIVLWVRSYWWMDSVTIGNGIWATSVEGCLRVNELVHINTTQPQVVSPMMNQQFVGNYIQFSSFSEGALIPAGVGTAIPYGFLVVATAAIAAVPWIRRRYSLRTLLIGMTLIAIVLGILAAT